jgi:hypothetical protein
VVVQNAFKRALRRICREFFSHCRWEPRAHIRRLVLLIKDLKNVRTIWAELL